MSMRSTATKASQKTQKNNNLRKTKTLLNIKMSVTGSAGLTIVANVALATDPALFGAPQSSVINLSYYIINKNLFSLRSREVSILLNFP